MSAVFDGVEDLRMRSRNIALINQVLNLIGNPAKRKEAIMAWQMIGVLPDHAAELLIEINGLESA
jgi:hypothetical protein